MPEQLRRTIDHQKPRFFEHVKKPGQKIVEVKKSSGRPIEQILVGTWNAVKPESQGKAIMKVYDRYFKPKYANEQERLQAEKIRPKVEKIVGWSAVAIEAGIVTFGVVKGYKYLRNRMGVEQPRKIKRIRKVTGEDAPLARAMRAAVNEATHAMTRLDVEGYVLDPTAASILDKCELSGDLRKNIQLGFAQRLMQRLADPEVQGQVNAESAFSQREKMKLLMDDVVQRWMAQETEREVTRRFDGMVQFAPEVVHEVMDYLRVVRTWYANADFPGIGNLGITLLPMRTPKIAAK